LISARPLMGAAGAGSLAQVVNTALASQARFDRMTAFFTGVGSGQNAGVWEREPAQVAARKPLKLVPLTPPPAAAKTGSDTPAKKPATNASEPKAPEASAKAPASKPATKVTVIDTLKTPKSASAKSVNAQDASSEAVAETAKETTSQANTAKPSKAKSAKLTKSKKAAQKQAQQAQKSNKAEIINDAAAAASAAAAPQEGDQQANKKQPPPPQLKEAAC
ncbi:MAG: hypothetical protein AAGG72_04175, partial [Pseudomonadota bacterium]